jgi:hypothetical protein
MTAQPPNQEPIDLTAKRAARQQNDMLIDRIKGIPEEHMSDEEARADPTYPGVDATTQPPSRELIA